VLVCIEYAPRRYIIQVLSDLAAKQNITDISDDHIVAWANEKVHCFCVFSFFLFRLGTRASD
jgi:cysteinyl-tRNA synthetase